MNDPVTAETLHRMKRESRKIVAITAYDYPTALLQDRAGVDIILVGDSLSMVVLGLEGTRPVSIEAMLHHTAAVRRGVTRAMLWGDLPYAAYQENPDVAVANARRFFEEGGVNAIKLEGGRAMASVVEAVVAAGMPLVGHVGLLPQSVERADQFRVQGRSAAAAEAIIEDAKFLEAAGAVALVLECIPQQLAGLISSLVAIPTIGIGAGLACDGQVQVIHDLVGLAGGFAPKHAKRYLDLAAQLQSAVEAYRDDVVAERFPTTEQSFTMKGPEWDAVRRKYSS